MTAEVVEMLEKKIDQLIAHCDEISRENQVLKAELSEKARQITELEAKISSMLDERREVSGRIERLISRIDEAAGAGGQEAGSAQEEENTISFPQP